MLAPRLPRGPSSVVRRLSATGALALTLLGAGGARCGGGASKDPGDGLDCDRAALHTEDGEVDTCDRQACQACVDECGSNCAVLESYPPQYACAEQHTYTVYDFCPGWQNPGDAN